MVRIPRAEQQVRGTTANIPFQSAAGTESIAADAGRAAGDLAKGLKAVSKDLTAIEMVTQKIQAEDDEREVKQLDVEYANALRTISFGDGTAGSVGFYGLQGQAAVDAFPNLQKQMDEARRVIVRRASNTLVRDTFLMAADDRDLQQKNSDARFLLTERERANDNASMARKATAANDAAHNYNSPKALRRSLGIILAETFADAARNKWSKEQYEAALREGQTVVIQSAFNAALAAEDYNSAKRIFDDHEGMIDGAIRGEMLEALRDGSVRIQAQALSTKCQALFPNDPAGGRKCIGDSADGILEDNSLAIYRAALKDVDLDEARERRKVTWAEADVDAAYKRETRARAERLLVVTQQIGQHIEAGRPWSELSAELQREADAAGLTSSFQKREAEVAKQEPVSTNWPKYLKYIAMTGSQLKDLDLAIVRLHLADAEFNQIRDLVLAARQGKMDPSRPFTLTQMFDPVADDIGLGDKDKEDERGQLLSLFQQEVEREQENTGKLPTAKKIRDILNELVDETARSQSYIFTTEQFFEVEIPDKQREQIIVDLTAAEGRAPTEAGIIREYLLLLKVPKRDRVAIIAAFQKDRQRDPTEAEIVATFSLMQAQ